MAESRYINIYGYDVDMAEYVRTLSQKHPILPFNLKVIQKPPYLGKIATQNTLK